MNKKLYKIHHARGAYWTVAESEGQAVLTMCKAYMNDYHKAILDLDIKYIEVETRRKAIYEHLGLGYAEEHGIVECYIKGNTMIYYESFPYERATYKSVVNLDTMEETRTQLKGYYKPYKSRIGGKYQANYC